MWQSANAPSTRPYPCERLLDCPSPGSASTRATAVSAALQPSDSTDHGRLHPADCGSDDALDQGADLFASSWMQNSAACWEVVLPWQMVIAIMALRLASAV